jgi:hypothetical protein
MNPLTQNPDLALTIARRTIDDRIHDAERRAEARAARASLRAARRQTRPATAMPSRRAWFPRAVLRLMHPAH